MEEEETKCEPGAPGWVVTFGDMMSLLLTFFILLLSFAKLEKTKFKVFSASMKKAFGVQNVTPERTFQDGRTPVHKTFSLPFRAAETLEKMKDVITRHQSRSPKGKSQIKVEQNNQGVMVTFPYESLFESGRAVIRPEFWSLLDEMAKVMRGKDAQIRVGAFTDRTPINSKEFSSNDYLAAARSASIINYLQGTESQIDPARFESAPFGEHRPITAQTSLTQRERERRIEVLFYKRPNAEWNRVSDK